MSSEVEEPTEESQAGVGVAGGQMQDLPAPPDDRPPRRRNPLRWLALAVGAVLVVPLLFVLGSRFGKDPRLVRSPLLGKPAPAFSLPRIDGPGQVSSSELSGRVYVINFWASWCVPCREENGVLQDFYERWRPRGVELVGILYSDTHKEALRFRRELGGRWPILDDPGLRTALDFGVRGVPETFVVDDGGVVMAKFLGAVSSGSLDGVLAQVSAGGAPVYSENDRYRQRP